MVSSASGTRKDMGLPLQSNGLSAPKGHRHKARRFSARKATLPLSPGAPKGRRHATLKTVSACVPSGLWEMRKDANLALKRQALCLCPFGATPPKAPTQSALQNRTFLS